MTRTRLSQQSLSRRRAAGAALSFALLGWKPLFAQTAATLPRVGFVSAGHPKDVAAREDGLYGDLHYLRSHPLAEMTAEAAERLPEALGLSHNAEGRVAQSGGTAVVEEIVRVRSVDLVADPATTRSLFEEVGAGDSRGESGLVTRGASDPHWRPRSSEPFWESRPAFPADAASFVKALR